MRRAVLVRRFLLLVGDLHANQLRRGSKSTKDGTKTPNWQPYQTESEKSWYPKAPPDAESQVGVGHVLSLACATAPRNRIRSALAPMFTRQEGTSVVASLCRRMKAATGPAL